MKTDTDPRIISPQRAQSHAEVILIYFLSVLGELRGEYETSKFLFRSDWTLGVSGHARVKLLEIKKRITLKTRSKDSRISNIEG